MSDNEIWYDDCDSDICTEQDCSISNSASISDSVYNKSEYLELLIAEVFQREALWNSSLPYKCRGPSETKELWFEIDIYLGTSPGTSQSKWKNLRDRFVKEHALQSTYVPSGSAAVKKRSSWPFYENLLFLAPTISYRKTKSNIENVSPQINMPKQNSLLKAQLSSKAPSCSTSNSANSNITICEKVPIQKRSNTSTPDTEVEFNSPKVAKRTKKLKSESVDTRIEEAILKELQQTRPTNEPAHIKSDKIESFTKYLEACLRGMISDVSNRVINKISHILLEEDM